MDRKAHQSPAMVAVTIRTQQIMDTSVTSTSSNSGMSYGGGGTGPARSRRLDEWLGE